MGLPEGWRVLEEKDSETIRRKTLRKNLMREKDQQIIVGCRLKFSIRINFI